MLNATSQWIFTRWLIWPVGVSCPDRPEVRYGEANFSDTCEVTICVIGNLSQAISTVIVGNSGPKNS
jgi:hypothetical protein